MQSLAPVYIWEPPTGNITVHLSLDVVSSLSALMKSREDAGKERAVEIGGLLLGGAQSGEKRITVVEDFEPFPCEYVREASYTLSAKDRRRLDERLRRSGKGAHSVVGFYRSHTRPGLYLDQDDLVLADACFAHPSQVVLAVKPALAALTGGFFFWEEGEMRRQSSYLEFPFDTAQLLAGGHRVCKRSEQWIAAPAAPAFLPPRLRLRRWQAVLAGSAVLAGTSYVALRSRAPAPATSALGLRVERSGDSLRLSWDRNTAAVRRAAAGSVQIHDAGGEFKLHLPVRQIEAGSITYFPMGEDVSFDVEIHGPGGRAQEVVRAVMPPAPAPRPSALLGAVSPPPALLPAREPGPDRGLLPSVQESHRSEAHRAEPPAPRSAPRRFEPPAQTARLLAARELAPPPQIPMAGPARLAPRLPEPSQKEARVALGPATPTASRLGKVPALFGLARRRGFVAPRPIHQIRPVVPASLLADHAGMIAVEIKVRVDQAGHVTTAELLGTNAPEMLQELVLDAARGWQFAPAQLNGRAVASQSVLRFRFEP